MTVASAPSSRKRSGTSRKRSGTSRKRDYEELWDRPGFLIRRLHQIHMAIFQEECAEYGITPVQFGILSVLVENGGIDQVSLGFELGIDRTNVADVLKRLERRGFLVRREDPHDRRSKLASITRQGRRFARKVQKSMERAQERLVGPLSPGDRDVLMNLLRLVVEKNNEYSRAPMRAKQ